VGSLLTYKESKVTTGATSGATSAIEITTDYDVSVM